MNIPPIVFLLLPPLIGAVIGFVTNSIAIRMLFRPLRKIYIFSKIPLPLTPGIIPRQREKLAHSIGRMVSRSLFNAEVITQHIRGDGFQNAIRSQLSNLFTPQPPPASSTDTPNPSSPAPATDSPNPAGGIDPALHTRIDRIEHIVMPMLASPLGKNLIRSFFQWFGSQIAQRNLNSLFPLNMRNSDNIVLFFRSQIEGRSYRRLVYSLVAWLRKREMENVTLNHFFTEEQINRTISTFSHLYVPTINFILSFLRRPDIRRELIKRGKVILSDIMTKLNPVQRIVLSAGQYDRTLEENMPSIISDLIKTLEKTLRSRANREKILAALHSFLSGLLEMGLKDIGEEYGFSLSKNTRLLFARIKDVLGQEEVLRYLAEQISNRLGASTVNDLVQVWKHTTLDTLLMKLYDFIIVQVDDPEKRMEFKKQLASVISLSEQPRQPTQPASAAEESAQSEAAGNAGVSAGTGARSEAEEAAGNAGARGEASQAMVQSAAGVITAFIEGAVPSLIENFNIYQMVVDRINALDVEEVEELLLGIIARHLKYINIFGAVLGAIIGGMQSIISLFSR